LPHLSIFSFFSDNKNEIKIHEFVQKFRTHMRIPTVTTTLPSNDYVGGKPSNKEMNLA